MYGFCPVLLSFVVGFFSGSTFLVVMIRKQFGVLWNNIPSHGFVQKINKVVYELKLKKVFNEHKFYE